MGTRVIRTFIDRGVLPLKMSYHHQWEFWGPTNLAIESRVTIHEDDLDQLVMDIMGVYTLDRGRVFNAGHPPLTDGPLIGVVSHPPIPPYEVIFSCTIVHVVSLY